jgi:TolA-binding protein
MNKYLIALLIAAFTSATATAQYTTNCTNDLFGISCKTKPSGDDSIDFGAFQRGAQQANQEIYQQQLMWQQMQMQQQLLEQQQQMRQQQEYQMRLQREHQIRLQLEQQMRLQQATPDWQPLALAGRDEAADDKSVCLYPGTVFIGEKRYAGQRINISKSSACPIRILVSKIDGSWREIQNK